MNRLAAHRVSLAAPLACLAAPLVCLAALCSVAPAAFAVEPPDGAESVETIPAEPTGTVAATVPETLLGTVPEVLGPDTGAATPAPVLAPSAPLIQVPAGCPAPPIASVVFVGTLLAKDRNTARYRVDQIRAGNADGYIVIGLVDVRYDDETQYLTVDDEYLIGAAPSGTSSALTSKVRPTDLLLGGNAVIGLTEKDSECPTVEDPIRTLQLDGSDVETSMFIGLEDSKTEIAMAFVKPLAVAFGIILVLVLVRWLFTAIFVAARKAADGEPLTARGADRRRHLPDL